MSATNGEGRGSAGGSQSDESILDGGSYDAPALLAEDAILFPEMEVSMTLRDSKNVVAVAQAFKEHKLVVLIPSQGGGGAVGSIGTLVLLREIFPAGEEGTKCTSKGLWRVRVEEVIDEKTYIRARFARAGESTDVPRDPNTVKAVFEQIDQFVALMPGIPPEIIAYLKSIDTPGKLADVCAYSPFLTWGERLELLNTLDPEERLEKVRRLFERQLAELRKLPRASTITECPTCNDLADKAFELGPGRGQDVAREFLAHVVREHPDELLALLAAEYGPAFLRKRALR